MTLGKSYRFAFITLCAFALLLACQVLGQTPAQGFEGSWKGLLKVNGESLHLELIVTKSNAGGYAGKVDRVDQGATIPIDVITVKGNVVRLELKAIKVVFIGRLNKERTELAGKFRQDGAVYPLVFKRGKQAAATKAASTKFSAAVPLDVQVPVPPTAFKGAGKTHLVYELHITNFDDDACTLMSVEVNDPSSPSGGLAKYEGEELWSRIERVGVSSATGAKRLRLGGGSRTVVYIWITVEAAAPASLQHRLIVKLRASTTELLLECASIAVGREPIVISPPLRGSGWIISNGPSNTSGHRRTVIALGGDARIAQRFAIDWAQMSEDGKLFTGDRLDNKNYVGYGAEVLAVADATVVDVKDGIPENVPGVNSRIVPITLETIAGNYVILDLGQGHFAFYAHLQPGKLLVKTGDKVQRGQVIGYVGNSGNSTGPHLHFHISNANSPLGCEGLPFVFDSFEVLGKGWGWTAARAKTPAEKRANEMPLEYEVVRFPAKQPAKQ